MNHKNGKLEGIFKWYYEDGRIQYLDTYKNNILINSKEYDEKSKLKSEQNFLIEGEGE